MREINKIDIIRWIKDQKSDKLQANCTKDREDLGSWKWQKQNFNSPKI